jgi:glutathione S-transferase
MAMMLFYSPVHDFIHKSVVVAEEVGVWPEIVEVPVYPRKHGYSIAAINPLQKVPTLALDDGTILYGSQTIAEYLDSISRNGAHVYPPAGPARWNALTRLARADIIFDLIVRVGQERLAVTPGAHIVQWNWPKFVRSFDQMEQEAGGYATFDIGHIGTLQALTYFDRQMSMTLPAPAPPNYNWRDGRPKLAAWFDRIITRRSVAAHFKKPQLGPDRRGDDSPEFCQAQVAKVLHAQGRDPGPLALPAVDFVSPETAPAEAAHKH